MKPTSMKVNKFVVLIAGTVVYAILGAFFYFSGQTLLRDEITSQLNTIIGIQKSRVNGYINTNEERLDQFSSRLSLRTSLDRYNSEHDPESQKQINNIILAAKKEVPYFLDIHILDLNGTIIASTMRGLLGTSKKDNDFFLVGKDKKDVTSLLYKDTGKKVRQILTGPLTLEGRKIGVVVIEVDTKPLFDLFKDDLGLGKSADWGISKRTPEGDALAIVPLKSNPDPNSSLTTVTSKTKVKAPIIRALAKEEGVFTDTIDYRGIHVLSATRYIEKADWGLGVKVDRDEAFAPMVRLRNLMIMFILALMVFAIMLYQIYDLVCIISPVSSGKKN
jgi:hypothetical protein